MTQPSGSRLVSLPTIALVVAMVLWSSSFIALKISFRAYDPMFVIFGRMVVASLCFLFVGKRLASSLRYRRGDYKLILFMAFCEPCLYFIFEAKAVENTTASQAGIITAMLPILVIIAAAIFLKEQIHKKAWLGAITAVAGVLWLTAESSPSSDAPNPVLGNFLEFLAMVCATGYTISLKALTDRYSPWFLTATQALIGSFFYFPLLFFPVNVIPSSFVPVPAFAIVYLGGAITLGAYGLYNYGIKHVPANRGAIFINLIPIFSVILGWLILEENFTPYQFLAGLLILSGVFLSQKS